MKLIPVLLLALVAGCAEIESPTEPTSARGSTSEARIEYRVSGNATSAVVRHSNSVDGLTQVTTTLPYIVNFKTDRESIFLSIEATPSSFPFTIIAPFMSVQIFVNGELFREATSTSFSGTLSVNGTWRN